MSSPSKRTPALLACALLCAAAAAEELEISSSPTPVGSGARAAGMADAFVAIADDATAASWNPAGLVQLERPEASVVGSFNQIIEQFGADYHPEVDSRHSEHLLDLNYFSVAYPMPFLVLGRNVCVSLNYQRKYDFTRKFSLDYSMAFGTSGTTLNNLLSMDFTQTGGLSTLTPAFAFEITHRLSLGASINLWRSSVFSENSWEQTTKTRTVSLFGPSLFLNESVTREEYQDFRGENLTLGMLWSLTDRITLGGRYDTSFAGEADYLRSVSRWGVGLASALFSPSLEMATESRRETREVRFPASAALGLALRANDRLTFSLDVTRTGWNDFYAKDGSGSRRSLVDASDLDGTWFPQRFQPTHTARFGAEYVFIPREPDEELNTLWTLRGGFFWDQEPASGRPNGVGARLLNLPGGGEPEDFFGIAAGIGLLTHQRVNIDLAYQLRFGEGVNMDFIRGVTGFEEDVQQHRILLSTVIYL